MKKENFLTIFKIVVAAVTINMSMTAIFAIAKAPMHDLQDLFGYLPSLTMYHTPSQTPVQTPEEEPTPEPEPEPEEEVEEPSPEPPASPEVEEKTVYKATISWEAVEGAIGYTFKYRKSSESSWTTLSTTTNGINLEDLMNAGKYYWQVQAVFENGTSDWSEEKRLVTYPRKVTKSEFTFPKSKREARRVRVKIETMAKRITGFNVLVYKKQNGRWKKIDVKKIANKNSQDYVYGYIKNLKPNTKYKFTVKARRTIGNDIFLSQNVATKYITTLKK